MVWGGGRGVAGRRWGRKDGRRRRREKQARTVPGWCAMVLNDSVCRSDILDTVHCRNAKSVCSNLVVLHGRRAPVRSRRPACCGPILQPALAWCRVTDHLSVCAGHRSAARRCIACQYGSVWAARCALRCAPICSYLSVSVRCRYRQSQKRVVSHASSPPRSSTVHSRRHRRRDLTRAVAGVGGTAPGGFVRPHPAGQGGARVSPLRLGPLRATPSLLDALCRRTPHRSLTGSSSCPVPQVSSASCRMPCCSEEPPRRSTPGIASHATPTLCRLICAIASMKFRSPVDWRNRFLKNGMTRLLSPDASPDSSLERIGMRASTHEHNRSMLCVVIELVGQQKITAAKNHRRYGAPGVPPGHRPKGDRAIEAREGHRWRSAAASPPRAGSCHGGQPATSAPSPSGKPSHSPPHEAAGSAYLRLFFSRSSNSSAAVSKRARCVRAISSASAIAARVFALGTSSANGICLSATTRIKNARTASETDRPIAANVSVACALIRSSTRT